MNYCPNCGVEISNSANFCSECGEQIGEEIDRGTASGTDAAQRNAQTSTDRIQLNTGSSAERIYNTENISYYLNVDHKYTLLAKAGFAALVLLAFWVGSAVDSRVVTVLGLGLIVIAGVLFSPDDSLAIGTLADKDEIDTDDPDVVETDFLEKTSNHISIEGAISSPFYKLGYTYHFLKENIISIERFDSINKLWPTVALLSGIVGLAVAYVWVDSEPTVADVNTAISIGIVSNAIACVGVLYLYYGVYTLRSYLSKKEISIYLISGFFTVLFLPLWWQLPRSKIKAAEYSTLMMIGAVEDVQLLSVILGSVSVLLVASILYLPPPGVLISLPSNEQIQFPVTEEDAETVITEFGGVPPNERSETGDGENDRT
jgi:hypothetical protein